jgi:hypothetical protein
MAAGEWHGRGRLRHASGYTYDGEWHKGEKHGNGTMVYASGDVYVGQFEHGRKHGHGTQYIRCPTHHACPHVRSLRIACRCSHDTSACGVGQRATSWRAQGCGVHVIGPSARQRRVVSGVEVLSA